MLHHNATENIVAGVEDINSTGKIVLLMVQIRNYHLENFYFK